MAQSVYERERLVEVNRLLPDIRDFLKDVIKNEVLSSEVIGQCDAYIERLNAIIQPPSLPPRSGRAQTVSYNDVDSSQHPKLTEQHSRELIEGKLGDVVSSEYLEQQRELSRQQTKKQVQLPYESQRKTIRSEELPDEVICSSTGKKLVDRQSAIYEKILSTSSPNEEDGPRNGLVNGVSKLVSPPPPVPARGGKGWVPPTHENTQNNENTVVMVHDLKDPLYSGLLRNVRANIKQWGVIMSQKLYLFNDLEKPANFIGDLRFYEVKRDHTTRNVFHVTGRDMQSIVLAAVNDAQYQLWYNAFRRAKIMSDAAVGKFNDSGEMAEYVSADYVHVIEEDDYEENDYEQPSDSIGINLDRPKPPSESYVVMNAPTTISTSSIVYEAMGMAVPLEEQQDSSSQGIEREDSWQSQGSFALGVDEVEQHQDYTTLPLPPLPSPTEDKPPGLPLRGHKTSLSVSLPIGAVSPGGKLYSKSDDEGSFSDNNNNLATGSIHSLDSLESENVSVRKDRSLSRKTDAANLKRMQEKEFLSDTSALFCGVLHKRKILAVWQKHYCKVKDSNLLCYRSLDNIEASYEIKLPGYQLDRADEITWRKFAFKLHKDSDVYYFAAEDRTDLVKWLNVLAKEMNKERFVAITDPDMLDMPPRQKSLNRQESTDESEGSQQNVNPSKREDINDHTSDFDADNESGESEHSDKKSSITDPLPKNFLQVSKNRRLRTREDDSPDEPDAQIQGYLFRKFHNHWTRRWCSVKGGKLFIYRHSPRDLPEAVIIMKFAALTIPPDDGVSVGWYLFKITYEGEQTILLSTKYKDDWFSWRKCIEEYIGSRSEEPFPYINVPASSTMQKNINSHFFPTDEDEVDDIVYEPIAVSSPIDGHDYTTTDGNALSSSAGKGDMASILRRESELDTSYYYGHVTKLEMVDDRVESTQLFVVLTKDKYLKLYSEKNATHPINAYNALMVEYSTEVGGDPCILRLSVAERKEELVLKAPTQYICEEWKEKLNMIHYAEIDDFGYQRESADFSYDFEKTAHEKMFRKRSKSIDRQTKNEPVLISHSKTLPHMGKLKKRAKEQNNVTAKSKRLSYQRSEEQINPSKKGLTSFIRSFTVDTLGRKAKNKTFDFSNDTTLKETQNGHLIEVVYTKSSVTHEQRYCRISGKVLYCYANKNDLKHIWKVTLANATIEDSVDSGSLFKIKVTALDTGEEYILLFNSEEELSDWVDAMYGEDKLHTKDDGLRPTDPGYIAPLPPRKETPPTPRKNTSELSLPLVSRTDMTESSPALPARSPTRNLPKPIVDEPTEQMRSSGNSLTVHNKRSLTHSLSAPSPPLVPDRVPNEQTAYDSEDTPAPPAAKPAFGSPPVPMRMQSRPSYKHRQDDDSTPVSTDRIPLSGNVNGIDKQQLTHTLSNGDGAPPMAEASPPVPRRMKNSKFSTNDVLNNSPLLGERSSAAAAEKKVTSPTLSNTSETFPANDTFSSNKDESMEVEADGPGKWFSTISGSLSSLSSSNTTSTLSSTVTRSTLSETDSKSKSKEQKLFEEDVLLEEFMHEMRQKELAKMKLLRWLVLRKTVLEVYNKDRDKTPCKIINLENSSLVTHEKSSVFNQLTIRLKDAEGFISEFLPQNSSVYKKWVSQIKAIEKSFRRNSKPSTKLQSVGDLIKRRDRGGSIKQLKSDVTDNRKSLCLIEDDFKAVQKYEESTDLSRTISGQLIEYFEDDKTDEKNRHCWIKDGYFYVAKESKSQKPIKKIDLSTVVILDESDPSKHNYAFKLNYTKDNKDRCIMLKAPNQNAADKWMVSVSMGILLHRLKSPQVRTSFDIEEPSDKDHEFVQIPPSITTPTYPHTDFELGIDIKREIAKKAEDGEEHFANVSELLRNEFPTPNDSPSLTKRNEQPVDSTEVADGAAVKNENILPQEARFSHLPCMDDVVFSDTEDMEMLENIPDRDHADERFKNVRGILKQQESIRRAIIHRQKSNASQKAASVPAKKKVPPKTKPKPVSRSKISVSNTFDVVKESFIVIKDTIDNLTVTELHNYSGQLESEKTTLQNIIRDIQKNVTGMGESGAGDVTQLTPDSQTDVSPEVRTLLLAQERLQLITNECNRVRSQLTRCVSKKFGEVNKDSGLYNSGRFKRYGSADCLLSTVRNSHLNEKGYNSEPPQDEDDATSEQSESVYEHSNSIII